MRVLRGYVCCVSDVRSHLSHPLMLFLPPSLLVARETALRRATAASAGRILSPSLSPLRDTAKASCSGSAGSCGSRRGRGCALGVDAPQCGSTCADYSEDWRRFGRSLKPAARFRSRGQQGIPEASQLHDKWLDEGFSCHIDARVATFQAAQPFPLLLSPRVTLKPLQSILFYLKWIN